MSLLFRNLNSLSREMFVPSAVLKSVSKSYHFSIPIQFKIHIKHLHYFSSSLNSKKSPCPAIQIQNINDSALIPNSVRRVSRNRKHNYSTSALGTTTVLNTKYHSNMSRVEQVPKNIFITGANSGLGLEMVKQFLSLDPGPSNIFTTYRDLAKSTELVEIAKTDTRIHLIKLDVRRDCSYCSVLKQVFEITKHEGINLLINNAGIFTERQSLCEVDKKTFLEFLEVNTVAPVLITKELFPLLIKASEKTPTAPMGIGRAAVVNITSSYGSISSNDEGNFYYSRCCRSALNAASKTLSIDLKPNKILVAAISPGWVRTEQGGPSAPLSVEESIKGVVHVLQHLSDFNSGMFLDYTGKQIPW